MRVKLLRAVNSLLVEQGAAPVDARALFGTVGARRKGTPATVAEPQR